MRWIFLLAWLMRFEVSEIRVISFLRKERFTILHTFM